MHCDFLYVKPLSAPAIEIEDKTLKKNFGLEMWYDKAKSDLGTYLFMFRLSSVNAQSERVRIRHGYIFEVERDNKSMYHGSPTMIDCLVQLIMQTIAICEEALPDEGIDYPDESLFTQLVERALFANQN